MKAMISLALLAGWIPVILLGCTATSDPSTGDIRLDLRHRDPRIRMEAAYQAAKQGRRDLVDELVENLEDRDESVRFFTGIALKRMTGQSFGFRSFGSYSSRKEAVERWRKWCRSLQESGTSEPPGPDPESLARQQEEKKKEEEGK